MRNPPPYQLDSEEEIQILTGPPWLSNNWIQLMLPSLSMDADWSALYAAIKNVTTELAVQCAESLVFTKLSCMDSLYPTDYSSSLIEPNYPSTDQYFDGWPSTPYPSPQTMDDVAATNPQQPVQFNWDIYNTATPLDSDAGRQQWLHAKLCDSLREANFSITTQPRNNLSGSSASSLKRPSLDQVVEGIILKKKKKPQM
jgi:hypothetical protein